MKEFAVGDKSTDGVIEILAKDSLCYQVRSVSRGATGIRTISKRIVEEWVTARKNNPNNSSAELRDLLCGKSEIDKFEYGYFGTLHKMAAMMLGIEPMIHVMPLANNVYQKIIYGAPGTGKSHETKKEVAGKTWFRTTFHPDSDYASFVGTYKPTMREDGVALTEVSQKNAAGQLVGTEIHDQRKGIAYGFVDQVFTKAYVEAWRRQKKAAAGATPEPVYLVIEEINRGNCAQVFGDIFQLLDRKTVGFSEYSVEPDADLGRFIGKEIAKETATIDAARKAQINALYPEATFDVVDEVLSGNRLLLPDNFFIRATMNTSDQSLFPMDSAFKRRWDWQYIPISDAGKEWKIRVEVASGTPATKPDNAAEPAVSTQEDAGDASAAVQGNGTGTNAQDFDWWKFLEKINALILSATESEDKQLGYFFAKPDNGGDIITAAKFVNKVLFYLFNDVFKDYDLPKEFARPDGKGKFAFKDFFLPDGKPNEANVRDLLTKLLASDEVK